MKEKSSVEMVFNYSPNNRFNKWFHTAVRLKLLSNCIENQEWLPKVCDTMLIRNLQRKSPKIFEAKVIQHQGQRLVRVQI